MYGSNPYDLPDDEDLCASSVRKAKVVHEYNEDDEELSDYVKTRLFIARQLAMAKYREKYGKAA